MQKKISNWDKKVHVASSMQHDDSGYAMFLGRWQPLHDAHKLLFEQSLSKGNKICIMIRNMPTDEKNPYTAQQVKENIEQHYTIEIKQERVVVMIVPNITSINFGRGVGYDIIEHIPPVNIAQISATNIRLGKN